MFAKIAIVAMLSLLAQEGCDDRSSVGGDRPPPFNKGPANVGCTVTVDFPHWSKGNALWIVGKVRATCSGNIDSLVIEAKLQRRENGEWYDLITARPVTSPPYAPVKAGERYTYQAEFPCSKVHKADVFRTAGRASGTFGGKPAGSPTWKYNPPFGKEVRCQ